jgi:hypothetical protein
MALDIKALVRMVSVPVSAGVTYTKWAYASADAAATIVAAGYFNGARDQLKVNDTIDVMAVQGGTGDWLLLKATAVPASGDVTTAVNAEAAGS